MERTQNLVVVLHGFHAMRILDELVEDRQAATNLFRERLNDPTEPRAFSDAEWQLRVEPKAWEFLVHKEFEARGLPDFEAVRVPVKQGSSLDTRCLHGGAPGDGSPGLCAHAYGMTMLSRSLQLLTSRETISSQSTFSTRTTLPWGPGASALACGGSTAAAAFGRL
jgi:hypothetical protein